MTDALPASILVRPTSELADGVRIFHGHGVERAVWAGLDRLQRRQVLVRARFAALRRPGVVSHRSAAALWGLPEFDAPDERLHVVDTRSSRTHCGSGTLRHAGRVEDGDATVLDGVPVTSLVRTVLDVVRSVSFTHAVVVLDRVLRDGAVTRDELRTRLDELAGQRGSTRALEALAFADPSTESPGESVSRVALRSLRVSPPMLQREFRCDGHLYRVDFWWPDSGVVGEFDGRVKYDDHDALWAEKRREDALRRLPQVRSVARWTMDEALDLPRLAQILLRAGPPVPRASLRH